MDFGEALEFSKKFRTCHPKVFKGFTEWGIYNSKNDGYVVLTDVTLADEPLPIQLEEYVKIHKLRVDHFRDHLIISSVC